MSLMTPESRYQMMSAPQEASSNDGGIVGTTAAARFALG